MLLSVIDRYRTQPNASTCGGASASRLPLPLDGVVDVACKKKRRRNIKKPITMKKKRKKNYICVFTHGL
jgi:hypothetical protein